MNSRSLVIVTMLGGLVGTACGGAPKGTAAPESAPAQSPSTPATTAASASPPSTTKPLDSDAGVGWNAMSPPERKEYMKTVVLPEMKAKFTAFDSRTYGSMNCETCHGAGAKTGKFTMPNPDLPALPANQEGFKTLMQKKPDVMKFMSGEVLPTMAHLVGESPYNPETKQGFGCFECHTKK